MSWDDFVTERIFKPLQMKASNTSITRSAPGTNFASAHEIIDGEIRVLPLLNADNYAPAGSINSNLTDMAQWLRLQMGPEPRQGIESPRSLFSLVPSTFFHECSSVIMNSIGAQG